jgi:hypothetical protein
MDWIGLASHIFTVQEKKYFIVLDLFIVQLSTLQTIKIDIVNQKFMEFLLDR